MLTQEEIIELGANKNLEAIKDMFAILYEAVKQNISALLIDNTEENPFITDFRLITMDGTFVEEKYLPRVTKLFHDKEGIIWYTFDYGPNTEETTYEFDELSIEEQLFILNNL